MTNLNPEDPFDLGIWTQSPPRKKVNSLSLEKMERGGSRSRFVRPQISLETYQQRFCPDNTKINTRWAVKISRSGQLVTTSVIRQMHVRQVCCSATTQRSCPRGCKGVYWARGRLMARNTPLALYKQLQQQQQPCCFSGAHLHNCTINTVITITEHKLQSCMLLLLVFW